jgi:hypothetical protein
MSSVIFQPLLHDPLGWKQVNTTYADTFNWKKYRSPKKDKRISTYGQQYERQLKKQQKLQQTNNCLPSATNEEQTIQRLLLVKKNEENRRLTPASDRSSPSKTPPAVTEELPVVIVESKQRTASINRVSLFTIEITINKTIILFRKPPVVQELHNTRQQYQLLRKVKKSFFCTPEKIC